MNRITNGSTGQMFAVTIFAKKRKNAAIKNLLGEPGVINLKEIVHESKSIIQKVRRVGRNRISYSGFN
jgi:hypothetical protein